MNDPYCLAMILCDAIHRDPGTGKFTLLGTYSTLAAIQYPAAISGCVYFAITDGSGEISLTVRIVESQDNLTDAEGTVVYESPPNIVTLESPLVVLEGGAVILEHDGGGTFKQVMLPRPGMYHCELLANGTLLMSRRLLAVGPEGMVE